MVTDPLRFTVQTPSSYMLRLILLRTHCPIFFEYCKNCRKLFAFKVSKDGPNEGDEKLSEPSSPPKKKCQLVFEEKFFCNNDEVGPFFVRMTCYVFFEKLVDIEKSFCCCVGIF